MIKEIVIYFLLSVYIVSIPCLYVLTYVLKNEIKKSRIREDLLLQEVKILDYQLNIMTDNFINR